MTENGAVPYRVTRFALVQMPHIQRSMLPITLAIISVLCSQPVLHHCRYSGGDCANPFNLPFGPSMLGIGFLLALAVLARGTPCMTRGSFISVGSSLAGAIFMSVDLF